MIVQPFFRVKGSFRLLNEYQDAILLEISILFCVFNGVLKNNVNGDVIY